MDHGIFLGRHLRFIAALMPDRLIMAYPQLPVANPDAPTLDDDYSDIPISAVGLRCRSVLSMRLDVPQLLLGPLGHRDWRGLALLVGFSCDEVELLREQGKSPTSLLLDKWEERSGSQQPTVGQLVQHLESLERYDVLDDTRAELRKDVEFYRQRESSGPRDVIQELKSWSSVRRPIYDAFVCYTVEDWSFVRRLVERLEPLGLRLFLPNRDLKAGVLQYSTFYELMEKWCRKTIIVFSPNFLQSQECRVQQRFIESINIEQAQQKLIPVVIRQCKLDGMIKMMSKINLCDDSNVQPEWGWTKLIESVRSCGDSRFISAHSLCTRPAMPPTLRLPAPPSRPASVQASSTDPAAVRARTYTGGAESAVPKSKTRWFSNIFGRKKASSVSNASSGYASMAIPE